MDEPASRQFRATGRQDVVLTAARQTVFALQYASADLRADTSFMLVAAVQKGFLGALHYAAAELWADRDFACRGRTRNSPVPRCGATGLWC